MGAAAKQGIIRNAQNSVCHVKQVLGRTFDDAFVTDHKRKSAVTVSIVGLIRFSSMRIKNVTTT